MQHDRSLPNRLCATCGTVLPAQPSIAAATRELPTLDDLAAALWVQDYDAAWLGQDWERLQQRLAPDVQFVASDFSTTVVGRSAVLANIQEVMRDATIHEYNATDLTGYDSGPVGVIRYRWQLDCTIQHERRQTMGHDVLVLRAAKDYWELTWRAQFRA